MNNIKVLIAEDDERIAAIQHQLIDGLDGFEVVGIAHSFATTQQMTSIITPDLLLLDIQFPDGNGLDFVNHMREQKSQTDVILITASRDVEMLKSAIFGGVFDYIVKPLVFDRVISSLERYRQRRIQLSHLDTLDQQSIDTIFPPAQPAASLADLHPNSPHRPPKLPKGIDVLTLQKINTFIRQTKQDIVASNVGISTGVSRSTARRYLEYLVSTSELKVELSYGSLGRPERHYLINKR